MDITAVQKLWDLNNRFYREQGASFARTRGAPWHGWKRCLEVLQGEGCIQKAQSYSVLDLACGNMRFETFLRDALSGTTVDYYGVDNSTQMMTGKQCQDLDVLELLIQRQDVNAQIEAPLCDLSVSFGFMHHIPGQELRKALLDVMIAHAQPGGHIIVSFWQFLNSPELARKAELTHREALDEGSTLADLSDVLDAGDYFLGWQGKPGACRYCHSFSSDEISWLVEQVADRARLVARFDADGRTGDLNCYIVLKVNS